MLNARYGELLKQASALAVMGGSAYALRHALDRAPLAVEQAPVLDAAPLLRRHRPLLRTVDALYALDQNEQIGELIEHVERILEMSDEASSRGAASTIALATCINREVVEARRCATELLRAGRYRADSRRLERCIQCADEHVPAFEAILEQILHNAILDTSPQAS